MEAPDLTGVVVVGALVGLLFVALGYGQMVWLARQRRAQSDPPRTPLLTALLWISASLAAASAAHALVSRTLPEREALLSGEDLFSVRPRPGLLASYAASGPEVRKGEVLIQFGGQDGEEALLAVRSRRRILEGELELERSRPLDLDPELVRRADTATLRLRELENRAKQLASERDGIVREVEQQRLAIGNRRFRIEQEDRAAARDLQQARESLDTQRKSLQSHEALFAGGMLSRLEITQERDAVKATEGRAAELSDRRILLERERQEVASLRSRTEATLAAQLGTRESEQKLVGAELLTAREASQAAEAALQQDRPRAQAQSEKRTRQIQVQIEECDALLSGRGKQAAVEAPWDGRIAFREPSPSSAPADNGPLLVMSRPGMLAVTVRLDPGEAGAAEGELEAEFHALDPARAAEERAGGRTFAGRVAQRTLLPLGFVELRVPCEPDQRLVRQVAMGGSVPVRARLRRSLAGMLSFRIALSLSALAVLFGAARALRRRRQAAREVPAPLVYGAVELLDDDFASPRLLSAPGAASTQVLTLSAPTQPLPPPRAPRDARWLTGLGARFRHEVESASVAPDFLHQLDHALRAGGYPATALVVAGFGNAIEKHSVARAAFSLLDRPSLGDAAALGEAARDCALFLTVMRAIGSERLNGAIDHLRSGLLEAALGAAQRGGTSVERAGILLRPLTEA